MNNRSHTAYYLVYSDIVADSLEKVTQHPRILAENIQVSPVKLNDFEAIQVDDAHRQVLLWINQVDYPKALMIAQQKGVQLGFLPVAGDKLTLFYKSLGLNESLDASLEIALQESTVEIDLIQCNGDIVVDGVNLENQTTMAEFLGDSAQIAGFRKLQFRIKRFIHAFSLKPHPVTLTTAKGKKIPTAITGMLLLDFHQSGALRQLFEETVSLSDHRISVVLFAPQSILSYLQLSTSVLLRSKKQLLNQIGYIRTESLHIESPEPTHYLVNNRPVTAESLTLSILPTPLQVKAVDDFQARQQFNDDKENVICDQLPQQDERIKYLSKTLPFFPHALESDFKELFLNLKDSANASGNYVLLMVLSVLLASLGLFLNSPSVVIGAMVLAPLMSPIIALSMGVLRSDAGLSRKAFMTVLLGVTLALALSAGMAWFIPFHDITHEIAGRLHPSMLDLMVAILSGIAGALANARENIAKSLPGVAIAVALVPPLCVAGIGLGWWQFDIFYGAMLLFLTNLTGIILAAGLTFMLMGFAPFSRARTGILVSLLMVLAVSFPLSAAFEKMQTTARIKQNLLNQTFQVAAHRFRLRNITIQLSQPVLIRADLLGSFLPDAKALLQIEKSIEQQLGRPVRVEISFHWVSQL